MYTFIDRGERSLTLRPEATAPVVRAFIEHNLGAGTLPVKLYYFANMFRYERPQAGRYREFWQLGVEALGSAEPAIDAEAIALAVEYLRAVGIDEATLKIGSMGDDNCRPAYMETLRAALAGKAEDLCEDCGQRLQLNPLRVFDCKNPGCQAALVEAPKMIDNLCGDCRAHFNAVGALLGEVGIEFEVDPMLVRGFDYYTRTTFEIQSAALGAQNALGGGGRYDRLVADYGGRPTPAVGFALGIERLMLALPADGAHSLEAIPSTDVFIAVIEDKDRALAFKTAVEMRRLGLTVELDYMGRSLKSQMKLADKCGALSVAVFGPDELAGGEVKVRDLASGEEKNVPLNDLSVSASKGFK